MSESSAPDDEELYQQAIDQFGVMEQVFQAEEELTELLTEMDRYASGNADDEDIIDELADVHIMVEQMALIHGYAEFEERVSFKKHRLKERLNSAEADDA